MLPPSDPSDENGPSMSGPPGVQTTPANSSEASRLTPYPIRYAIVPVGVDESTMGACGE